MTIKLPGACSPPAPGTPAAGTPRPAAGQAPPAGDREESSAGGSRGTVLDAAALDVVLDALTDAGDYRWNTDADCERCGPGLCADHQADTDKAVGYAVLARKLRKAAGR